VWSGHEGHGREEGVQTKQFCCAETASRESLLEEPQKLRPKVKVATCLWVVPAMLVWQNGTTGKVCVVTAV